MDNKRIFRNKIIVDKRKHKWSIDTTSITGKVDFNCIDNRKKLYLWDQSLCQEDDDIFYKLKKDRPCSVPYSMHKIPKEEKVGLKWQWARPLDRNNLPKNELAFSIYLIDGQPTIRNPTLSL